MVREVVHVDFLVNGLIGHLYIVLDLPVRVRHVVYDSNVVGLHFVCEVKVCVFEEWILCRRIHCVCSVLYKSHLVICLFVVRILRFGSCFRS